MGWPRVSSVRVSLVVGKEVSTGDSAVSSSLSTGASLLCLGHVRATARAGMCRRSRVEVRAACASDTALNVYNASRVHKIPARTA